MVAGLQQLPSVGGVLAASWSTAIFLRAIGLALLLGLVGGAYPAYRATLMQPVEALRYE
jgi:putative ABC transport system permease protein